MRIRRRLLAGLLGAALVAYVGEEVVRTLRILDRVEAERDGWQRADTILAQLDLRPGTTVVDLGTGAGYFALKMAPRVGPTGRVLAVDLRRESLAFLWLRARLRGFGHVVPIVGAADDPRLPGTPIDGVLIANTYHELTAPAAVLTILHSRMRAGGRLVVVDRRPRVPETSATSSREHHEVLPDTALPDLVRLGFRPVLRDDTLIDRPGDDDVWWLLVFEKV